MPFSGGAPLLDPGSLYNPFGGNKFGNRQDVPLGTLNVPAALPNGGNKFGNRQDVPLGGLSVGQIGSPINGNPYYNPDQRLNPDIYGTVYGGSNDFNPFSRENILAMQNYLYPIQGGQIYPLQHNVPAYVQTRGGQIDMSGGMPVKQPPIVNNNAPVPVPIRNIPPSNPGEPVTASPFQMLMSLIMQNPGNFRF